MGVQDYIKAGLTAEMYYNDNVVDDDDDGVRNGEENYGSEEYGSGECGSSEYGSSEECSTGEYYGTEECSTGKVLGVPVSTIPGMCLNMLEGRNVVGDGDVIMIPKV